MEDEDEDYGYLILNLIHYKICTLSDKGKGIIQNKDTSLKIREQLNDFVNNAKKYRPSCS